MSLLAMPVAGAPSPPSPPTAAAIAHRTAIVAAPETGVPASRAAAAKCPACSAGAFLVC